MNIQNPIHDQVLHLNVMFQLLITIPILILQIGWVIILNVYEQLNLTHVHEEVALSVQISHNGMMNIGVWIVELLLPLTDGCTVPQHMPIMMIQNYYVLKLVMALVIQ
ncbi:MAG: hypothetical protein D3913_12375 [Candidatus Electrothrix sp. LOE1_4_5]|nr:hypothetical protein [Candidatus Electrothrix gigas]